MKKYMLVFCLMIAFSMISTDSSSSYENLNVTHYVDYDDEDIPELVNL